MSLYLNEIDPYAAQWLRNLYPAAIVDTRSIVDVQPDDLVGYRRAHFFGGIGGWEYALDLAGWPADREVWTGSCPCQPFSAAGKRAGEADARHLWPEFYRLIRARRPEYVFGEQVGGTAGYQWLAGVHADLAAIGYHFGAVDIPVASVGAPHIRQRLYWVAHLPGQRRISWHQYANGSGSPDGSGRGLADDNDSRGLEHAAGDRRQPRRAEPGGRGTAARRGAGGLAYAGRYRFRESTEQHPARRAGCSNPWDDAILIPCADGRSRRIPPQPGIFPLADGVPAALDGGGPISRVGALRGAGNAIVPHVAATFVQAFLEVTA